MPPIFTVSWRRFIKAGWLTLGFLSLALGTAGIVLPLLPTVPFYMLTVFCFAKGSNRLHDWFRQSDLYKKHLAEFMEKKSMTLKTKTTILSMAATMMAFSVWITDAPWPVCLAVAIVWCIQLYCFLFVIKTER